MLNNKIIVAVLLCLIAAGSAQAADKKPIKIYLMAGQSNMEGHNYFGKECTTRFPGIDKPRDDVWCIRAGKISGPLKCGFGGGAASDNIFGPELVMGRILGEAVDNPIVMFKSATGGTQLHTRWRPPSAVKRAGGRVGDLYLRMMRRFHRFLANPKSDYPQYDGQKFELAGFVWFQGENDSLAEVVKDDRSTGFWNYYEENLRDLIHDVRTELAVPKLPVLIYQIGPAPVWNRKGGGKVIRAAQKKVAEADGQAAWVSTMDLHPKGHYNTPGMITIGERGGKAMLPFIKTTVPQDNAKTLKAGRKYTARAKRVESKYDLSKLTKGLIGYWSFDEGKGATTKDHAGCADGKLIGKPEWTQGVIGKSLQLTGLQHVQFPDYKDVVGASGNIENLTVSYWYRTNYYGCGRIGKGVGKKIERAPTNWYYSHTANVAGWDAMCWGTKGGVFITAGLAGGTKGFKFNGGPGDVISDGNEWRHVAVMYDGSRKAFEIYIDGVKAPKGGKGKKGAPCGQLDKPFWGIAKDNHIIPAKDAMLMIGNIKKIARQFEAFDEVGIWSRPLSEEQVLALYNKGHGVSLAK
ncbi:MAG: sialate O-acetylesterase [Phycisphaerae bacterium]|jgi:alpha-galactosidase|nr:sialate O-acetylesterase [Phycisphaerae bacterium]